MQETALSRELKTHRELHPGCDVKCQDYLDIARKYTAPRAVLEGARAPYTRLSVVEQH